MDPISLDKYGRQISLGDWVAIPDKFLSSMDIKLGKVVGFTKKKVKVQAMNFEYNTEVKDFVYKIDEDGTWTTDRKPEQCIVVKYNPDDLIGKKTNGYH